MGKLLNETKVKKILKVDSLDTVDSKKASQFVSMLGKIDKNVAIKGLENSSKIASAMKETLVEYYKSINHVVKSADDSIKSVNENYKNVIQALIKKLDNKDISPDDSKFIIDKIIEIQKLQSDEIEKHRNFLLKVLSVLIFGILAFFGIKNNNKKF